MLLRDDGSLQTDFPLASMNSSNLSISAVDWQYDPVWLGGAFGRATSVLRLANTLRLSGIMSRRKK
jgi:hypothetical protein